MGRLRGGVKRSNLAVAKESEKPDPNRPVSWRSSAAKNAALRATQSVLREILKNCVAGGQQNLDKFLILANESLDRDFHASIKKYVDGEQAMDEPDLMGVTLLAHRNTLLNKDQLSHLGYLPLVEGKLGMIKDTSMAVSAVRRARERAKRRFDEGIARLLKGEMPLKAGRTDGRKGTVIREKLNDVEMAKNYVKWIAGIKALGGRVTMETWAPGWYHSAEAAYQADLDVAYWASIPEWQRELHADYIEALCRDLEDEAEPDTVHQSAPLPPWYPANVRNLKLWFGGREWSSRQHAIEDDWWTEVRGDDLSDFFDRHDARMEARYLASLALTRKA